MTSRLTRLLSLIGLAAAIATAYVAYIRSNVNVRVRAANEAVATATDAALRAQTMSREVGALLNETSFQNERAKLTATARATSRQFAEAGAAFRLAADRSTQAIEASDTPEGRTYFTMKRASLVKRAETAEAAHEGYAVVADESIAELATVRAEMEPFAVRAETARAEAKRLAAEAEAFREQHRGEF